jgi:hypothetical protein
MTYKMKYVSEERMFTVGTFKVNLYELMTWAKSRLDSGSITASIEIDTGYYNDIEDVTLVSDK